MKRKAKMKILPNLDMVSHEEPVFSQIVHLIQSPAGRRLRR
jgi:hypothetical protein